MHRISLLLILILFTSCSMNRIKPNAQPKQKIEVDIVSYRILDSDSFNVNILLKIPLKTLVFKKQKNHIHQKNKIKTLVDRTGWCNTLSCYYCQR